MEETPIIVNISKKLDSNNHKNFLLENSISHASYELRHKNILNSYTSKTNEEYAKSLYAKGMNYIKERTDDSYKKAFDILTEASIMNHAKAQYNLGVLYEFGLGVDLSLENAARFYTKASLNGYNSEKSLERIIKKKEEILTF